MCLLEILRKKSTEVLARGLRRFSSRFDGRALAGSLAVPLAIAFKSGSSKNLLIGICLFSSYPVPSLYMLSNS